MAVANLKYITEEEYLALEEKAEVRHEYLAGQIFAMAGGSPAHARCAGNLIRALGNRAEGGSCGVYTSDLRIRVDATRLNTYPDVSVVCGELRLTDRKPQACTNPSVLVEVLSESTQEYDRGEKWRHYQTIESLTDYLLVWQDRPRVEHYSRQSETTWNYRLFEGLDVAVPVDALGADISLAEIFRGIDFPQVPVLR